ncbi:MAG: thiamine phosphate synthase, partial [Hyphomicrobium sp.]
VHLAWSKDQLARYSEAREILGARFIVGVDAGRSRDVAMSLGEDGADYIAFGIPPHVEDRETAFARQLELISWWSEIFEPPCVAFDVADDAAAFDLAAANADFVALAIDLSQPPEEAARRVKDFSAARVAANATA